MKTKISKTLMTLYQYLYYTMLKSWGQLGIPPSVIQGKTIAVLMALELFLFLTVSLIAHHVMTGHSFVGADLPDPTIPLFIIGVISGGSVFYYITESDITG